MTEPSSRKSFLKYCFCSVSILKKITKVFMGHYSSTCLNESWGQRVHLADGNFTSGLTCLGLQVQRASDYDRVL